uniref:Uncharacterized protein n=1 Tax=Anguilla anguilla TaxID=7936 RepID=A0A0E9XDP8_ANGAN
MFFKDSINAFSFQFQFHYCYFIIIIYNWLFLHYPHVE